MKHWSNEIFNYGEIDGILYHISEVENGLKCNCFCPNCNEKLIAVNNIKGLKPAPHFRHYSKINCDNLGYQESLVHKLSKEIIKNKGYIIIPKLSYYLTENYNSYLTTINPEDTFNFQYSNYIEEKRETYKLYFENIFIEKKEGVIKPDIKVIASGKPLLIEIAFTHFVDDEKKKIIKNLKLNAIEINLSSLIGFISEEEIEKAIYDENSVHTYYLNNEKNNQELKKKLNQAIELREYIFFNAKKIKAYAGLKRVYNCPLKKNSTKTDYVLISLACRNCKYFVTLDKELDPVYEQLEFEENLEDYLEKNPTLEQELIYGIQNIKGYVLCSENLNIKLKTMINNANKQ